MLFVTYLVPWLEAIVAAMFAEVWVEERNEAHRRQTLVVLGREVLPHVAGDRVGRHRAARVGLHEVHRNAIVGGQIVASPELRFLDLGSGPFLVLRIAQPVAGIVVP